MITLSKWRKAWRLQRDAVPTRPTDHEGWGASDKFTVVLETAGLDRTELAAYFRELGLFPEQVDRWRQATQDANAQPLLTMAGQKDLEKRHQRPISRRSSGSCRSLHRKDKAPGGGVGIADRLNQDPGLLGAGRGRLTSPEDLPLSWRSSMPAWRRVHGPGSWPSCSAWG